MTRAKGGRLDERLSFQERTDTTGDGYGNYEAAWAEQFIARARRINLRGSEAVQSARLEGRQPVIFGLRASANAKRVTSSWRIVDLNSGTVFNVSGATQTEDRREIEILAESGVADG